MEKRIKIEAVNGEIVLPEAIIHHILSFLNGKQAARTSILSKCWYSAWSTRPNLDFNHRDIEYLCYGKWCLRQPMWDSAKRTLQRYEELNLKIESFKLCAYGSPRATELILKAMKLCVTDFHFEILGSWSTFDLPREVLESETLTRLSLIRCKICLRSIRKVGCSRLKSLILSNVLIEDDRVWDIISSCPLIEELSLSGRSYLFTRIKYVASPLNLFGKQNVRLGSCVPANLHVFRKLKYLLLEKVKIDPLFFSDFSSRFPCLRDLTLDHCIGYVEIHISSPSLERISFAHGNILVANFDVPSVRKFSFSSSSLPSLSLVTASRDWDSYISITCPGSRARLNSKWLLKLRKLLIELSPSKISLSLNITTICEIGACYSTTSIRGLPKVTVENLGLPKVTVENLAVVVYSPSLVCRAFLDDLFQNCRPKCITQYWMPKSAAGGETNNNFLKLLCKTLIQGDLRDLEQVNMQVFEQNCSQWRPFSWKTLLDTSENQENKRNFRFQLKWR